MGLDVYLKMPDVQNISDRILFREDGAIKELTRAEWDARYPGREPIYAKSRSNQVYWRNITHNLSRMAEEAGGGCIKIGD